MSTSIVCDLSQQKLPTTIWQGVFTFYEAKIYRSIFSSRQKQHIQNSDKHHRKRVLVHGVKRAHAVNMSVGQTLYYVTISSSTGMNSSSSSPFRSEEHTS